MIPPGSKAATASTAVLNSVGSTAVSRLNLLARLNFLKFSSQAEFSR